MKQNMTRCNPHIYNSVSSSCKIWKVGCYPNIQSAACRNHRCIWFFNIWNAFSPFSLKWAQTITCDSAVWLAAKPKGFRNLFFSFKKSTAKLCIQLAEEYLLLKAKLFCFAELGHRWRIATSILQLFESGPLINDLGICFIF